MRSTYSDLQTDSLNYIQVASTDTTVLTFVKREINLALRFIYAYLAEYITTKTQTASTVASQQYYHYPPDMGKPTTVTITTGSLTYNLEAVDSQSEWNNLNSVTLTSSIPSKYFPRRDDFGIWPIPQSTYTLTLTYTYRMRDLANDDYTTGTVSVTQNSATVTGSGTTFTAAMVGRWFKATTDGYPYRISGYTSATSITLESVYEGSSGSGLAYTIGESPEIPPDLHELIAYRVAARFFGGNRGELQKANYWENMFWTGEADNASRDPAKIEGGLIGARKRYASRSNSATIIHHHTRTTASDKLWGETISLS